MDCKYKLKWKLLKMKIYNGNCLVQLSIKKKMKFQIVFLKKAFRTLSFKGNGKTTQKSDNEDRQNFTDAIYAVFY